MNDVAMIALGAFGGLVLFRLLPHWLDLLVWSLFALLVFALWEFGTFLLVHMRNEPDSDMTTMATGLFLTWVVLVVLKKADDWWINR